MTQLSQAELEDLKSRPGNDCATIAGQWVALRHQGGRTVGPCPLCSRNPQSRKTSCFEIKDGGQAFVCAKCGDGGDVIKLVMKHEGVEFRAAVEWLGGAREVDPAIAEARGRERHARDTEREKKSDEFRQRERKTLYDVWNAALPAPGTPVEAYLRLRGLDLPSYGALRLRCVLAMPYFHGQEPTPDGSSRQRVIHRGPAMVAPIVGEDGKFRGLHFTYLDLDRPNGKALLRDPDTGDDLPAKKVRGSKTGGHIDLAGTRSPQQIIIGEGIETVLSVWLALSSCGIDIGQTAFWSAVDLGNLGGAAIETVTHPTLTTAAGRAQRVPGPDPDLAKPGIVLPDGVADVVMLGDGDSDRTLTECALYRGKLRWLAVNDRVMVRAAWAPAGMDFNDMVRA